MRWYPDGKQISGIRCQEVPHIRWNNSHFHMFTVVFDVLYVSNYVIRDKQEIFYVNMLVSY